MIDLYQQLQSFQKQAFFQNFAPSDKMWFRVLNFIFVKRLIQTLPLNHCIMFDFNDLKVLEY